MNLLAGGKSRRSKQVRIAASLSLAVAAQLLLSADGPLSVFFDVFDSLTRRLSSTTTNTNTRNLQAISLIIDPDLNDEERYLLLDKYAASEMQSMEDSMMFQQTMFRVPTQEEHDVMYGDAPKDLGVHGIVDAEHGLPASFDFDVSYSAGFAQGSRVIMFLGGNAHLVSHRIGAVTKDVTAAEVWEAAALAADVSIYVSTLIEWGIPIAYTVPIWSDSESAKWIAQDARAVKRIAYIARRCRFLQELEARGIIKILKILGTKNPVNCLTKATVTFEEFLKSFDYITGGATSLLNLK